MSDITSDMAELKDGRDFKKKNNQFSCQLYADDPPISCQRKMKDWQTERRITFRQAKINEYIRKS